MNQETEPIIAKRDKRGIGTEYRDEKEQKDKQINQIHQRNRQREYQNIKVFIEAKQKLFLVQINQQKYHFSYKRLISLFEFIQQRYEWKILPYFPQQTQPIIEMQCFLAQVWNKFNEDCTQFFKQQSIPTRSWMRNVLDKCKSIINSKEKKQMQYSINKTSQACDDVQEWSDSLSGLLNKIKWLIKLKQKQIEWKHTTSDLNFYQLLATKIISCKKYTQNFVSAIQTRVLPLLNKEQKRIKQIQKQYMRIAQKNKQMEQRQRKQDLFLKQWKQYKQQSIHRVRLIRHCFMQQWTNYEQKQSLIWK